LKKEYFNLKELVLDLVHDHKRQLQKSNSSTRLLCEFKIEVEGIPTRQDNFSPDIFINADKIRINQVLDNLLTNAIKFRLPNKVLCRFRPRKVKIILTQLLPVSEILVPEYIQKYSQGEKSLFSKFGSRSEKQKRT